MKKQITEENFFKILDKISNKRYAAMDGADEIFAEMLSTKDSSDLSHHIWRSISLELYHCGRLEDAVKAMLEAITIAGQLDEEEKSILGALYGDLSMFYESMHRYVDAYEYKEKELANRIRYHGEDNLFTRFTKEDLKRLGKFTEYSPEEYDKLLDELQADIDKNYAK